MRKLLLTTTALIALGSVSAVAADVSISGNARFRYNTWSDDNAAVAGENNTTMTDVLQLWVKSSATLDNGLSIGTNTRILTGGTVDRNWIDINGDFGQIDLGKQWTPSYANSLHENWMGTVAGGIYMGGSTNAGLGEMNTTGFQGGTKNNKVVYRNSLGGLNVALSFGDAGATSNADETSIAANYSIPMMDGNVKINYADIKTDSTTPATAESSGAELGVQYSAGFGRVYALQQNTEEKTAAGVKTDDQQNTTIGVNYKVDSSTQLVYYNQSVDQDGTTGLGDEFSSNTVGVRYDMTGGLRIGLLHSTYEYTDASNAATNDDGSATRLQIRVNF